LLITDMDDLLTPFVEEHGIGLINASHLHMGILTKGGPPPWHPAPTEVKDAGRCIVHLCEHRSIEASDLALQFCLAHPYVSTTLAGMSTVEQVRQNVAAAGRPADLALIEEVRALVSPVANRSYDGPPESRSCLLNSTHHHFWKYFDADGWISDPWRVLCRNLHKELKARESMARSAWARQTVGETGGCCAG
jgi:hypothetical protein